MFFDVKGICWTLAALLVVVLVCTVDLTCASGRDSRQLGTIDRVRGEIAAGKGELAVRHGDGVRVQIRDLRIHVRKLLKEGKKAEARRLMAEIQKLERTLPEGTR